ncbi:MAG: hypothetical protein ACOC0P_00010 [Planctomycetota bacterium]
MKPKGINFFEQHVEKIVLGAAGLIFLGLAARAFVFDSTTVTFNGREFTPDAVDSEIEAEAKRLESALATNRSFDYEIPGRLSEWFLSEHSGGVSEQDRLATPFVRPTALEAGEGVQLEVGLYAEFEPPSASEMVVVSGIYTVPEASVETTPELATWFAGQDPPYDVSAVHVIAEIDGTALREQLVAGETGRRAIPNAWWEDDMTILDVVLERQRRLPDGTWSETEVAPPLPTQFSLREDLSPDARANLTSVLDAAFSADERIYQPDFLPLINGEQWDVQRVMMANVDNPELDAAIRRERMAWGEVVDTGRTLDRYLRSQERARENERDRGGQTRGGGRGMGVGEGGGGMETGGGGGRGDEDRERDREEIREERIRSAYTEAWEIYREAQQEVLAINPAYDDWSADEQSLPERVQGEGGSMPGMGRGRGGEAAQPMRLGEEGGGRPMESAPMEGPAPVRPGGREHGGEGMQFGPGPAEGGRGGPRGRLGQQQVSLFENESLRVFAHDVSVEPGATYRYRLRVVLTNPFYQRDDRLSDEQKPLAERLGVWSMAPEWSDPVRVTPKQQFYVVDGRYEPTISARFAAVELYLFSGGSHRSDRMNVRPGDPIGQEKRVASKADPNDPESAATVDFFTGATMLDVVDVGGGTVLDRKTEVVVAREDGSLEVINPEEHRDDEERERLRSVASSG